MSSPILRLELATVLNQADEKWKRGHGSGEYTTYLSDWVFDSEWYAHMLVPAIRAENTGSNETYYFQETKMTTTETPAPESNFNRILAKKVAGSVAFTSVTATVYTIIDQNTTSTTTSQKVKLAIGTTVLGAMVAGQAQTYVARAVDEAFDTINEFKKNRAERKAEKANTTD